MLGPSRPFGARFREFSKLVASANGIERIREGRPGAPETKERLAKLEKALAAVEAALGEMGDDTARYFVTFNATPPPAQLRRFWGSRPARFARLIAGWRADVSALRAAVLGQPGDIPQFDASHRAALYGLMLAREYGSSRKHKVQVALAGYLLDAGLGARDVDLTSACRTVRRRLSKDPPGWLRGS